MRCKYLKTNANEGGVYCKRDDLEIDSKTFSEVCLENCEKCKLNGGDIQPKRYQFGIFEIKK